MRILTNWWTVAGMAMGKIRSCLIQMILVASEVMIAHLSVCTVLKIGNGLQLVLQFILCKRRR